ncbi:MAG: translation elongation factor Ts [Lentimicrobiaceae bacterium]|nr:translation elongation factor Ts [Lentimicrobiaceae bacterium]
MANITASEVNKLRQMTGAGMMDCKHALVETDGDFEKAVDYLRKKGQKVASKRADRDASEGIVIAKTSDDKTFSIVIMLNCETDFVGKNQEFVDFANAIVNKGLADRISSIEDMKATIINGRTVTEGITDLIGKTGEKMGLAHYECVKAPVTFAYNHHGNRLATIVGLNKVQVSGIEEIGHEIAMQVAAMNPVAIDKDDVDSHTVEREIEIGKEQARQEGKPEEMVEKIALGKLQRFYKENTLLNQEFIKDNKVTVGQFLRNADKELTVTAFKRFKLGE